MSRSEPAPIFRNIRMHTRYTALNLALLVIGVLLCVFDFSYTGIILDSMHLPTKGWQRVGVDFLAVFAALAVVAILAGIRWTKIASTALWTLTFFYFVLAVAVHLFPVMVIPAAILAAASAIVSLVEYFSSKPSRADPTSAG